MSSIFLCHSSKDKPFVLKLASDLEKNGVKVWVDQAEIQIGDSLIRKIRDGIDNTEFFGVIISKNSVKSEWVQNELDVAMSYQIGNKIVKVLPILLEETNLPSFIPGKLYADFTKKSLYYSSMYKLVKRTLGENFTIPFNKENRFKDIRFNVSNYLSVEDCPNCDTFFAIAYSGIEFFEGELSACPNCKQLYVYSRIGLQPIEYLMGEKPEDFYWTKKRCQDILPEISDYYGYYGYEFAFCEKNNIVDALDYINKAIAISPSDKRHIHFLKKMINSPEIVPAWFEYNKKFIKLKGDKITINYHIKKALNYFNIDSNNIKKNSVENLHKAINHLIYAWKQKLDNEELYKLIRRYFFRLIEFYSKRE